MLETGRNIPRLTAFKRDSSHFSSAFVFYFCIFLHVDVYMHVPTGAIVARSIALHTPLVHLYAVKSEASIATCTFSCCCINQRRISSFCLSLFGGVFAAPPFSLFVQQP